jgi:hypothetical protein
MLVKVIRDRICFTVSTTLNQVEGLSMFGLDISDEQGWVKNETLIHKSIKVPIEHNRTGSIRGVTLVFTIDPLSNQIYILAQYNGDSWGIASIIINTDVIFPINNCLAELHRTFGILPTQGELLPRMTYKTTFFTQPRNYLLSFFNAAEKEDQRYRQLELISYLFIPHASIMDDAGAFVDTCHQQRNIQDDADAVIRYGLVELDTLSYRVNNSEAIGCIDLPLLGADFNSQSQAAFWSLSSRSVFTHPMSLHMNQVVQEYLNPSKLHFTTAETATLAKLCI